MIYISNEFGNISFVMQGGDDRHEGFEEDWGSSALTRKEKNIKGVGYMCLITRKHVQASHFSFKILNRFYNIDSFMHEKLYGFLCQSHVLDFWHTFICVVVVIWWINDLGLHLNPVEVCVFGLSLKLYLGNEVANCMKLGSNFLFWYDFLSCLRCVAALG